MFQFNSKRLGTFERVLPLSLKTFSNFYLGRCTPKTSNMRRALGLHIKTNCCWLELQQKNFDWCFWINLQEVFFNTDSIVSKKHEQEA